MVWFSSWKQLAVLFLVPASVLIANPETEAQGLVFPTPSQTNFAGCADYATQVLRDPWDFTNSEDVPRSIKPLQYTDIIEPFSFANGILGFTSSGTNPYFSLSTQHVEGAIAVPERVRIGTTVPIDTSKYKTFSVRMFTNQDSFLQVFWSNDSTFAITNPISTFANEWRTYTLDLSTIGINDNGGGSFAWNAGQKTNLRFDPSGKAGANVQIDWMQLTSDEASCPQVAVDYQAPASSVVSLYIDDDTNPANGFQQHSLLTANGSTQTKNFSTARLFPGNYRAYGFATNDFATANGNAWDLTDSSDVDRFFNLTDNGIQNGKYCGTTTNTDGNFYLKFPTGTFIDTNLFKHVTVKISGLSAGQVISPNLVFNDSNQAVKDQVIMNYDSTDDLLRIDLTNNVNWSGGVYGLRIEPTTVSGVTWCVDWVAVTPEALGSNPSEPGQPSLTVLNETLNVSSSAKAEFVQPDNHGGRDCPTHYLGNPWTMDSQADIQGLSNITDAEFRPYNIVTDSRGIARTGDFLRGKSAEGSGDPKVFGLNFSSSLDADKCTHLCYSMILNRSFELYHSVARVTYLNEAGQPQDGDDVINPDSWVDSEVCLYMKELQQEPLVPPGSQHPWRGKINFLTLDPHEDTDTSEFFIDYIELREDHKADTKFAIVMDAPTSSAVELFYSTQKPTSVASLPSGATAIATLAAARQSNVYLWDTSGLANGTYYLAARVTSFGGNTVITNAPLPVVVDHSAAQETTAPILMIDSPLTGRNVTNSLQVAGAAFDEVRLATVEAFVDGSFVQNIQPNIYHKGAREQYPGLAPDKPGFNLFLDVSGLSAGSHTLSLIAYDTAGNTTSYSASFTKGSQADSDFSYPDANAAPQPVTESAKTLSVGVTGGNNVVFSASGYNGCGSTAVLASKTSDMAGAVTLFNGMGSLTRTASNVTQFSPGGAIESILSGYPIKIEAKKPPKKICRKVKVCKKVKGKKKCRMETKCTKKKPTPKVTPTPVPTATPTPTPTPTPAPVVSDGVIYFQARCNGADASNIASLDFGTQISNPSTTIFETALLIELQTKLSSQ